MFNSIISFPHTQCLLLPTRTFAQETQFSTVSLSATFLHRMTCVTSLSASTRERLQQHLKANGVMSTANARYASPTFGVLFEWVVSVFIACSGPASIHYASSPEMLAVLTAHSGVQVDIRDQVTKKEKEMSCCD